MTDCARLLFTSSTSGRKFVCKGLTENDKHEEVTIVLNRYGLFVYSYSIFSTDYNRLSRNNIKKNIFLYRCAVPLLILLSLDGDTES